MKGFFFFWKMDVFELFLKKKENVDAETIQPPGKRISRNKGVGGT